MTHTLSRSLPLFGTSVLLLLMVAPVGADDPHREKHNVQARRHSDQENGREVRQQNGGDHHQRAQRDHQRDHQAEPKGSRGRDRGNWLDQVVDQHRRHVEKIESWHRNDGNRSRDHERWQRHGDRDRDRWQNHGDRDRDRWQNHGDRERWQRYGDHHRYDRDRDGRYDRYERNRYDRGHSYGDRYRERRYERRHYGHSSRPWYGCDVRDGFYLRFGSYGGWSFQIPRVLSFDYYDRYDRYDEYYWGEVNYRGRDFDVYLFPVYYGNRVEYVPYAYCDGRLQGRGRLINGWGGIQIILDF